MSDRHPVMIKSLRAEQPSLQDIALLRHELEISTQLAEVEGVLKPLALEPWGNGLALILEDFGGEPLKKITSKRLSDPDKFLKIAIQLAETLGSIHQSGIIHKDINPGNILYNPATKQVKITGFGIASRLASENLLAGGMGSFEGKLVYISPEQTGRMNRSLDYRSDFYSLGVVFYELLACQLPFQSKDPLELVHAQIARQPVPLTEVKPNIPAAISAIVMKLLAKMAEDRYQSANGLKNDLEECLVHWQASQSIPEFPIGRQDVYDRFQVSQKLYGRQAEIEIMLSTFAHASQGDSAFLLVSGYAGIGKSTLVKEIHRPVVEQRGYFISGKFDQLHRNIPYSAIIDALQGLARQLLTESEESIQRWKERLLLALGSIGQVICDVIPEIELIIGQQPPVPELPPAETQNRFRMVFEKFIRVFAQREHPLVIFLDDLQWADPATLNLLQDLVSSFEIRHLMIIAAYRDNEIDSTHPLSFFLESLKESGVNINHIHLKSLEIEDLNQLLSDTLKCTPTETLPLAALVGEKTGGNPFFVIQLLHSLHQENLFTFDTETRKWRWEMEQIRELGITDNMVDLMVRKMQRLDAPARRCLQLAACIGNYFDLHTLAVVSEKELYQAARDLWPAVQAGLVLANNPWRMGEMASPDHNIRLPASKPPYPVYRFLHDKVQQAAYSLIDAEQKKATHLKIGRLLSKESGVTALEEKVFDIANHLNMGRKLIDRPEERIDLARLNLAAGRKARSSAAYETALKYFLTGIELLPSNGWETHYPLALELHTDATEAAFSSTDLQRSEKLAQVVLEHAETTLDKVKIYELQMLSFISQNRMVRAVGIGLEMLEMLGVELRTDLRDQDLTLPELEQLEHLPVMDAPEQLAAMRILVALAPPTFQTRPEIFPHVIRTGVHYCMHNGLSALAAVSYGLYGFLLLAGPRKDIQAGYHSGLLSLRLLDLFDVREFQSRVLFIFNGHIRHWKEHARATLQPFLEGIQSGLETGDLQFVGYNAKDLCSHSFYMGKALEEVAQLQADYAGLLRNLKQEHSTYYIQIWQQAVQNLMGKGQSDRKLAGEIFRAEAMIPLLLETDNRNLLFITYLAEAMLSYLFGDNEQAVQKAQLAEEHEDASAGLMNVGQYVFYYSLALLAACRTAQPEVRERYLAKVQANQERMRSWTPDNYRHACELVEAETARVVGKTERAMALYDQAIASAMQNEYPHIEALANELAADFYLSMGRDKIARMYLQEAWYGYMHWGASAKAGHLLERYPNLLSDLLTRVDISEEPESSLKALDLATVIKWSQAISSEIDLERLLASLMRIAIENAGAQKGFLILDEEGELFIRASMAVDQEEAHIYPGLPVHSFRQLSQAVVNYVKRTRESLLVVDAGQDPRFLGDPYIKHNEPKSLLCLPILRQGSAIGLLYLENNLAGGAFTADRIKTLEVLTSQAAISLENARLYADMKREAAERRKAEEVLRSIAEGTAAVTGGDFFRSLLRHLADAFHARRAFVTECTDPNKTSVRTIAYLENDEYRENFEYDLAGTPCEGVIAGSLCYYPAGLEDLFPKEAGMESYLGAPLYDSSGQILGHLAIFDEKPLHLAEQSRAIFEIFSARAGVELERKRSEEALRLNEQELRRLNEQLEDYSRNLEKRVAERTHEIEQRRRVAESLRDILAVLNSNRPLEQVLNYIVSEAGRLLASDTSAIYRLDARHNQFVLQSIQGASTGDISSLALSPGICDRIRAGQLLTEPDSKSDSSPHGSEVVEDLAGNQALLAVPLVVNEDVYGCLALFYARKRRFSNEDTSLAAAFADQVALAIENASLRNLARQAAVMEERARLARELHDSVTQSLYSLTLLAEGWQRMIRSGKMVDFAESLSELGEIAQQALKEMRLLVYELRPPALEQEGLLGALHQRLSTVEQRAGVEARLLAEDLIELPTPMESELYRIALEALNNALKHARATAVTVRLSASDGRITLEISDNGVGFDVRKKIREGGVGLASMRERAEQLGASLEVQSTKGRGTTVVVRLDREKVPDE